MKAHIIFPIAAALLLASCGQGGSTACQPRPNDTRVQIALGGAVGNFATVLDGVQIGTDCTTGTIVYHTMTDASLHQVQMISTDNGKWFIVHLVGLGDVQLLEIK